MKAWTELTEKERAELIALNSPEIHRLRENNRALAEALRAVYNYEADDLPGEGTFGSEVYAQARAALAKAGVKQE